jgi:heptosyltransferase-2
MPSINLGVVLPNWLGDAVMATPTIRALREHFGSSARLIGIMKPKIGEVLEGLPWFDERLLYERGRNGSEMRVRRLVTELRQRRLDKIVLLPNSLSSAVIAWLSGAGERIGYDRDLRGGLLTHRLKPLWQDGRYAPVSAVDYYLRLATSMGCSVRSRRVELATTQADEDAASALWDHHHLHQAASVVAFNTGGAFGAAKHWPTEYFAELARRIIRNWDANVLVLCGPAERETAAEIARQAADPRVISLAGDKLPLGLMKACIRRCDLLVSTDSGPRHFAAAFEVPTVALFGPIHPAWSINYNAKETQLYLDLACSPCNEQLCPLIHHLCMRGLSVDMVLAAVQPWMTREICVTA